MKQQPITIRVDDNTIAVVTLTLNMNMTWSIKVHLEQDVMHDKTGMVSKVRGEFVSLVEQNEFERIVEHTKQHTKNKEMTIPRGSIYQATKEALLNKDQDLLGRRAHGMFFTDNDSLDYESISDIHNALQVDHIKPEFFREAQTLILKIVDYDPHNDKLLQQQAPTKKTHYTIPEKIHLVTPNTPTKKNVENYFEEKRTYYLLLKREFSSHELYKELQRLKRKNTHLQHHNDSLTMVVHKMNTTLKDIKNTTSQLKKDVRTNRNATAEVKRAQKGQTYSETTGGGTPRKGETPRKQNNEAMERLKDELTALSMETDTIKREMKRLKKQQQQQQEEQDEALFALSESDHMKKTHAVDVQQLQALKETMEQQRQFEEQQRRLLKQELELLKSSIRRPKPAQPDSLNDVIVNEFMQKIKSQDESIRHLQQQQQGYATPEKMTSPVQEVMVSSFENRLNTLTTSMNENLLAKTKGQLEFSSIKKTINAFEKQINNIQDDIRLLKHQHHMILKVIMSDNLNYKSLFQQLTQQSPMQSSPPPNHQAPQQPPVHASSPLVKDSTKIRSITKEVAPPSETDDVVSLAPSEISVEALDDEPPYQRRSPVPPLNLKPAMVVQQPTPTSGRRTHKKSARGQHTGRQSFLSEVDSDAIQVTPSANLYHFSERPEGMEALKALFPESDRSKPVHLTQNFNSPDDTYTENESIASQLETSSEYSLNDDDYLDHLAPLNHSSSEPYSARRNNHKRPSKYSPRIPKRGKKRSAIPRSAPQSPRGHAEQQHAPHKYPHVIQSRCMAFDPQHAHPSLKISKAHADQVTYFPNYARENHVEGIIPCVMGDTRWTTGVHCFQVQLTNIKSNPNIRIGVANPYNQPLTEHLGERPFSWSFDCASGKLRHGGKRKTYVDGLFVGEGDIVSCIADLKKKTLSFHINDTHYGIAFSNIRGAVVPCVSLNESATLKLVHHLIKKK